MLILFLPTRHIFCRMTEFLAAEVKKLINLKFDETLAVNYKSISQKIRVMSEFWLIENLFCPCCGNLNIEKIKNNSPVADIFCGNCKEIFELKSKKK